MAGSVNKVILVGNLGRDPESKSFASGGKVVKFSLATSESWNDRASGDRKEKTEWHNVVIYDEKIGEVAEKYLRKGAKVYIEGAMQYREYDDANGAKQKIAEVVLQRFRGAMTMLEGRNSGAGGGEYHSGGQGEGGGTSRPQSRPQPAAFDTELDDDVPF